MRPPPGGRCGPSGPPSWQQKTPDLAAIAEEENALGERARPGNRASPHAAELSGRVVGFGVDGFGVDGSVVGFGLVRCIECGDDLDDRHAQVRLGLECPGQLRSSPNDPGAGERRR